MHYRTLDDYYHWSCDWCDSENRTLWVRVAKGEVICGACHRANSDISSTVTHQPLHRMMAGLC